MHDETLWRVAGVDLKPEETDLATLRQIELYEFGTEQKVPHLHPPTLEEYISICKKYDKMCVLELKTEMDEATTKRMIDRIDAIGWLDHVIFISFLWNDLVHVRHLLPDQKCQFLFGANEQSDALLGALVAHRFDVDIYHAALTEEWVRKYHDAGLEVNCWTVDDPADGERLAAWGVDQMTSNILE